MTVERVRLVVTLTGMALAVAGIARESRPVVWAAIAVLAVAWALRFWVARTRA